LSALIQSTIRWRIRGDAGVEEDGALVVLDWAAVESHSTEVPAPVTLKAPGAFARREQEFAAFRAIRNRRRIAFCPASTISSL